MMATSLALDSTFITALRENEELMAALGQTSTEPGRLYGTGILLPDEELLNVDVPYVIVTFDGLNNSDGTKDDAWESDQDTVDIGIEVTGRNREELAWLTQTIRNTIHAFMRDNGDACGVEDYRFSAGEVQLDILKPCHWQVLRYQCSVINDEEEEDDE